MSDHQRSRIRNMLSQLTNQNPISVANKTINPNKEGLRKIPYREEGKKILVAFMGTNFKVKETVEVLKQARVYGTEYYLVLSGAAEALLNIPSIEKELQPQKVFRETVDFFSDLPLKEIDYILAPLPTQNTITKLALGIQDQLLPRLMWEGLWRGIPLYMGLNQLNYYKGQKSQSPPLQQMVKGYIEKLLAMGVKNLEDENHLMTLIQSNNHINNHIHNQTNNPTKIPPANHYNNFNSDINSNSASSNQQNPKRQIITEGDLLTLPPHQKEIHINKKDIITPLAQDTAKARGIQIIKQNY